MSINTQATQLVTHLLNQTTSSLAILESLQIISPQDAQLIRSRLPNAYGPFPSLMPVTEDVPISVSGQTHGPVLSTPNLPPRNEKPLDVNTGMAQLAVRDPPPLPFQQQQRQHQQHVHARALWDYRGNEADDLAFSSGEILIIDEHVNPQWNRGHLLNDMSRRGLFPSNYVEIIPPFQNQNQYQNQNQQQHQHQGMVPYNPEKASPGTMAPYQQQTPGPSTVTVAQPQPPEHAKKSKLGKIGGQLGTAAVNGAGFGFGASLASEMVHKIF